MSHSAESLPPAWHEINAASPRLILLVAAGLAAALALSLAAMVWLHRAHAAARAPTAGLGIDPRARSFEYGPEEKNDIARAWEEQDATVRRHLETYGWIDREAGRARIPIERAMALLAEQAANEKQEPPRP